MKHKNADIICAWVNGASIQYCSITTGWKDAPDSDKLGEGDNFLWPHPLHPDYEYMEWRIKEGSNVQLRK